MHIAMKRPLLIQAAILACALLAACADDTPQSLEDVPVTASVSEPASGACDSYAQGEKSLYWGDLHVHTAFSLDAYGFGTLETPDDAYRFAKGGTYDLPSGPVRLERPLDFVAVTDHAEWLDLMHICTDPQQADDAYCQDLRDQSREDPPGAAFFNYLIPTITKAEPDATPLCKENPERCRRAWLGNWGRLQEAANTHDDPCNFSALIGFEWSATPGFSHTHRNVIFANENVSAEAIDYIRYPKVEDLWEQLNLQCRAEDQCDVITIPHNTNMGDGNGFDVETDTDRSLQLRTRYERLVEIHQEKGNSECLKAFGEPDPDGDCSFERSLTRNSRPTAPTDFSPAEWERMRQSYARNLLLRGLEASGEGAANPLQLGLIGSTDNHSATPGFVDEEQWQGGVFGFGSLDRMMLQPNFNPGGLVGVWAEQNTRESIFGALKRREVYGTSGPRISVRFTAVTDDTPLSCTAGAVAHEDKMIAMGGQFGAAVSAPRFKVEALMDAELLQTIEIIKGEWREGELVESRTALFEGADGTASFCQVWQDEDFDANAPAFWYARIIEVPKPRWSKVQCEAAGRCGEFPGADVMIQDRAWASPIWHLPSAPDHSIQ